MPAKCNLAMAYGNLAEDQRTALRRNDIGFVYQFHHLLPEFSALENLMIPQMMRGVGKPEAAHRARELLDYMGIGPARSTDRPNCPAANSSASRLPVPSPMRRNCCWPMNRPAISIRPPPTGFQHA